jgi:predicted dehydrogenase
MTSTKAIRLATVGTGYFSQFQYAAWARIPEVDLIGICSHDTASLSSTSKQFTHAKTFTDFKAMLDEVQPNLVDIITPPQTHTELVTACVERGIPAICQKPFTSSFQEATKLVELIKTNNAQVIIHENFRFQPWYQRIKTLLEENILGQLYQITYSLRPGDGQGNEAYLERQPYFQDMKRFLVHETAVHLIDVFRYLFGEVNSVFADLRRINPVIKGEDAGLIILGFENGARGLFDGNRLSDHKAMNRRLTRGEMRIEGEKGVLNLNGNAELSLRDHGSNDSKAINYAWVDCDFGGDCVYNLQRHVIDQLLGGEKPMNTAEAYLSTLEVAEKAYRSNELKRTLE